MVEYKCPPVMICGFNRPDCLKKVFDRVREAKPSQLFLVLDAPREGRSADIEKNNACKKVFDGVDWPCEVHHNYAEKNMGCRWRMTSAITWMFEHVEYGIILEDDCVADLTFFPFCSELLEKYKDNERLGGVCGYSEHDDFVMHPVKCDAAYYFDRLNTCCGWATWRRAWNRFDAEMKFWPERKRNRVFRKICKSRREELQIEAMVDHVYAGKCSSWATCWWVTAAANDFLFAHSVNSLISNIGFGADATHTNYTGKSVIRSTKPMKFPIVHPEKVEPNLKVERFMVTTRYAVPYWRRILSKIKHIMLG